LPVQYAAQAWAPSSTFLCVASSTSKAGTTWPAGMVLILSVAAGELVDMRSAKYVKFS
jgi:hypothetical protein